LGYYVVNGKFIHCEHGKKAHDQNVVDIYAKNLSWQKHIKCLVRRIAEVSAYVATNVTGSEIENMSFHHS
jgi:hypothetical protein